MSDTRTDTHAVHRREARDTTSTRKRHKTAQDRRRARVAVMVGELTETGFARMREGLR